MNNKAQAMIIAFVYVSIISLYGIYMINCAADFKSIITRDITRMQAYYAGEAGLMRKMSELYAGTVGGFTMEYNSGSTANPEDKRAWDVTVAFPAGSVVETFVGSGIFIYIIRAIVQET